MQMVDEPFDWLKAQRVNIFGQLVQLLIGGSFVTENIILI